MRQLMYLHYWWRVVPRAAIDGAVGQESESASSLPSFASGGLHVDLQNKDKHPNTQTQHTDNGSWTILLFFSKSQICSSFSSNGWWLLCPRWELLWWLLGERKRLRLCSSLWIGLVKGFVTTGFGGYYLVVLAGSG